MINKFGFYKSPQQQSKVEPQPQPQSQPEANDGAAKVEGILTKLSKKQTYLRPEEFHPFQIPPSLELAELHCRATQFGSVSTTKMLQIDESDVICNCCGQQQKELISVCSTSNRIYRINQAQGYYFTYIKVIIIAITTIFFLTGLYTIITTFDYCQQRSKCLFVYNLPIPQYAGYFTTINMVLNILAAYLVFPFALYLFYLKAKIHQELKKSIMKISDYSILISGIDYSKITDKEIVQALQVHSVQNILFTHQIGKYLPSMQKRFILEAKKNLYFKRGLTNKVREIQDEIYKISEIVLPFKNKINIGSERELRTDKIIVKFRTVEEKLIFSKKFHVNMWTRAYSVLSGTSALTLNDVPLYVENLGEPEEMIWQNLEITSQHKFFMVIINTFVSAIILAISFAFILFLTHQQNKKEESNQIFISFLMAFIIQILNMVLYLAIYRLTDMEKRITLTGKMTARIIRNVFVFFFNTTLIPFSLFLLDWLNSDRFLVYEYIISLFVVNNLISPLSPIFNPFNLYKIYCKRKIQKQGRDCLFTQLETNEIYEKSDFQLELKYELLSQRIMNCCFYAAIFPEVLILTIIGLGIDYWIEKWWLLNYCCIPKFSARLGNIINRITIFFPAVYLFGYLSNLQMMKSSQTFSQTHYVFILCFALLSVVISIFIYIFIKDFLDSYVQKHPSLISNECSVSVRELDYCDLNPTSFLHIDLENRVDVGRSGRMGREQNFEKIEEFVLKRKKEALVRRQTQGLKRMSFLKEVKSNIDQNMNHP